MTAAPRMPLPDARPVGGPKRPAPQPDAATRPNDVLIGEDWVSAEVSTDPELIQRRGRGSITSLNRSPLARKIIIFNLMALVVMVVGVLFLNPFKDSLVLQREQALVTEARLLADVVAARTGGTAEAVGTDMAAALDGANIGPGVEVFLFDRAGQMVATGIGTPRSSDAAPEPRATVISDFLNAVWTGVSSLIAARDPAAVKYDARANATALFEAAKAGETTARTSRDAEGGTLFSVATPVWQAGEVTGVVALTSAAGEIDHLVSYEREQVLQMFVIALLVSIGLSLVLASTIANPLSDLAAAAEVGRDRDARRMTPGRVRIPDLTARPDEIGRLSVAMRGMVAALYDRIDANEQFAADVAHEIKNPLASLRSAVGSLRMVKKEEHREKLLDVIEHDVRRLDRLVSDISNASRLDSELVKEEEEEFNLIRTLTALSEHLGQQAKEKGVELITDFPADPVVIRGLEARLAQVFVNLITNAISFCEDGDAVRIWARKRENRVLVVVEDTGPGIPEGALTKIFKRFYSDRPPSHFGNNSGLGLAISKQIVEAHGGVIWAENIRPTQADVTSDPLGARFVVGLPV